MGLPAMRCFGDYGAKFGNPTIFVSLIEWADYVITE
jgi:hypothetical protein